MLHVLLVLFACFLLLYLCDTWPFSFECIITGQVHLHVFNIVGLAGLWSQTRGISGSEGFPTWGVRKFFNDSDFRLTFRSPIMTVCATHVCKHHTWQFYKPSPVKRRSENNSEASCLLFHNENKGLEYFLDECFIFCKIMKTNPCLIIFCKSELLNEHVHCFKPSFCILGFYRPPLSGLAKKLVDMSVTPGSISGSTSACPWLWSKDMLQAYWPVCKFDLISSILFFSCF